MTMPINTVTEARHRLSDYLTLDRPLNLEEERSLLVCLDNLAKSAKILTEHLGAQWFRLPTNLQLAANEFVSLMGKPL